MSPRERERAGAGSPGTSAGKPKDPRKTFLDVPPDDFLNFLKKNGQPLFRGKQVYEWFFQKRAASFAEMSDLPASLRTLLEANFRLHPLSIRRQEASREDGTVRYFFLGHDGQTVSTVYLPEKDRHALCLSSQVGCAYRCTFCASGLVPFRRQLSAAEIIDQILLIERDQKVKMNSLLFMGMGEPLGNYTQVMQSIRWITAPVGLAMSPSRVTLSTSGMVPQIVRMADEGIKVQLAISLHAVRDDLRLKLMPVSGRFGVRSLIKAAKYYSYKSHAEVTFEYIVLEGVNAFMIDAIRLAYLTKGFLNKVNLIPYNPVPGLPYERPTTGTVVRFQNWLRERGVPVFVRKAKGLDIGSACGQLGAPTPGRHSPQ